jgi:hypothetical protein
MAYSEDVSTTKDIVNEINNLFREELEVTVEQRALFDERLDLEREAANILSNILKLKEEEYKNQKSIAEILHNMREGLEAGGNLNDTIKNLEKSFHGLGRATQELKYIQKQDQKKTVDKAKNNLQDMVMRMASSGGIFGAIIEKGLNQLIGKQDDKKLGAKFERSALALAQRQHGEKVLMKLKVML